MDQVRAKRLVAELKGQSVGDWLVGDYIGNGASAVVATATRGDQEAALKLIDPEMVERYGANQQLQRVKLQRSLRDHNQPNIVKIFDGGCCAQTKYLYLVMQKLTLPTLTSVVPDFPRHRIGVIIEQLAKAARYLECRSIVHRDIKPDNILITPDFTKAFLLDLGVVRFVAGEERSDGGTADEFLGTTRYSPPEFVARDEEDSTDGWRAVTFYQLGAVLHDMIMCRRLFDEINGPPAKLIDAVRTMQPVIEAGDVPSHLLSLARFCLQKHWRHRLELLRWDDFSSVPPIAVSGAAKDRIKRRLEWKRDDQNAIGEEPVQVREAERRKLLEKAGGRIASAVREACLQGSLFPPVEVSNVAEEGLQRISIRTGPSKRHNLDQILEIAFFVELLDEEGSFGRIKGIAAVGVVPLDGSDSKRCDVCSGELLGSEMESRLDEFLHVALDAAQTIGLSEVNRLIALEWPD